MRLYYDELDDLNINEFNSLYWIGLNILNLISLSNGELDS